MGAPAAPAEGAAGTSPGAPAGRRGPGAGTQAAAIFGGRIAAARPTPPGLVGAGHVLRQAEVLGRSSAVSRGGIQSPWAGEQVVDEPGDLVERELGGRVGVEHRGVVGGLAPAGQRGLDGERPGR